MELSLEEGHQEAGCYQAEGENKETIMKHRKDSVTHLPESLTDVAAEDPGERVFLGILSAADTKEWEWLEGRAERVHRKEESWAHIKVSGSPQDMEVEWGRRNLQVVGSRA